MRIAIYGSRRQDAYMAQIEAFLSRMAQLGWQAVMHRKLYTHLQPRLSAALNAVVVRVTENSDFTADYAVSLGGDGSFLRTAAWVGEKEIPIIGVNTGHLGFLASLGIDELPELPEVLLSGAATIESRSLIAVEAKDLRGWPYALNEVAITRAETSSIISVKAQLNDRELAEYRADGLIVATPTGSTAYNLSVGGPIVEPTAPVMVVSPIAAHSLSMRPMVVADSSVITLECDGRAPSFRLNLDGRQSVLESGTEVTLRRASFAVRFVRLPGHEFLSTLRNKLQWG